MGRYMIHYEQNGNYFVLLGIGFDLMAYSMLDLQKQAKQIYNINILTFLN